MNRHWFFGVALLLPCVAHAATEAPFAPLPNVPDHVATITVRPSRGYTFRERRTYHAGWTRVDGSLDQTAYRFTSYFGPRDLFITFSKDPSARMEGIDRLIVMRGAAMARLIRWSDGASKTGESEQVLGETCEVWNLKNPRQLLARNGRQLSCVTLDGIEMSSRIEGGLLPTDSFQVTEITRKPVVPGEVRPPSQRLALQSWFTPTGDLPRPSDARSDVIVVLKRKSTSVWINPSAGRAIETHTVRRHYPWTSTEDADDKGWFRTRYYNTSNGWRSCTNGMQ